MVELWTKRKFRCDCGNSKFGEFSCKLCPIKDSENVDNSYNHNFKGSYCSCGRPYPDPQADEQFEMIQCCICEDWFHENHLGLDSGDEVTSISDPHTFLTGYWHVRMKQNPKQFGRKSLENMKKGKPKFSSCWIKC